MKKLSILRFKYKDKNIADEDLEKYNIECIKKNVREKTGNTDIEIFDYTSFDVRFDRFEYITKAQFCSNMPDTDNIKSITGKYNKFKKLVLKNDIKPVALDIKGFNVYKREDIISALKSEDYLLFTEMFL